MMSMRAMNFLSDNPKSKIQNPKSSSLVVATVIAFLRELFDRLQTPSPKPNLSARLRLATHWAVRPVISGLRTARVHSKSTA